MANEKYLIDRDGLLVEIANGFHEELQRLAYDMGGSLMDEVEDVMLCVLNGYAYQGRIKWRGYGNGYGMVSHD